MPTNTKSVSNRSRGVLLKIKFCNHTITFIKRFISMALAFTLSIGTAATVFAAEAKVPSLMQPNSILIYDEAYNPSLLRRLYKFEQYI